MKIRTEKLKTLLAGVGIASITTVFLGFCLSVVGMQMNVILPTSAPIWVGISTMTFMISSWDGGKNELFETSKRRKSACSCSYAL